MKNNILLIGIILIAVFLRFWQIDSRPAGFNADEAAHGYNAYSLITTGKDEFGASWPVLLTSFGDYKPAGMTYLAIPLIKIFGLTELAVRLPSLIAGVLCVLMVFLLVQEIFNKFYLSLLAALFLAISPWHIHFSRGGWETNIATFLIVLGLWLFFKGLKKPSCWMISIIPLSLSLFVYHAPKIILPLLGLFMVVYWRKELSKNMKAVSLTIILGILIILPLLYTLSKPTALARFSGLSLFADIGPSWRVNRLRGEHAKLSASIRLVHNKAVEYGIEVAKNWLSHFDGAFLFITGDNIKRSNAPGTGEMHVIDLLFIVSGLVWLILKRPKYWLFVIYWLLVAPLPGALTFQTPSALRAHNMVIPLVIISAYGAYNIFLWVRLHFSRYLFFGYCVLFTFVMFWSTTYFSHQYLVHYPKTYPEAWEQGVKSLAIYLNSVKDKYAKIYVTDEYDQPYILFLFYLKYPPEKFQSEAVLEKRDKFGFSTVRDFDKFHFERINWKAIAGTGDVLVCGTKKEIPDNSTIVKIISFSNNEPAYLCVQK